MLGGEEVAERSGVRWCRFGADWLAQRPLGWTWGRHQCVGAEIMFLKGNPIS